jgi:hypothetical protein
VGCGGVVRKILLLLREEGTTTQVFLKFKVSELFVLSV